MKTDDWPFILLDLVPIENENRGTPTPRNSKPFRPWQGVVLEQITTKAKRDPRATPPDGA